MPTNGPFNQGDLRLKAGTKNPPSAGPNDYYTSKVEIYGINFDAQGATFPAWKNKRSTFFPDNWSEEKIQGEISYGFQNKVYQSTNSSNGADIYEGTMSDGTLLEIIIINNAISSSYPKI
ncbi:MAG: hypothetical protein ACJAZM_003373 [Cyclobacteriaceae bacterium]